MHWDFLTFLTEFYYSDFSVVNKRGISTIPRLWVGGCRGYSVWFSVRLSHVFGKKLAILLKKYKNLKWKMEKHSLSLQMLPEILPENHHHKLQTGTANGYISLL